MWRMVRTTIIRGGNSGNLSFLLKPVAPRHLTNSADSQFFICFADCPFLDGQYTIWGEVVSGMEVVDRIQRGDRFRAEVRRNAE